MAFILKTNESYQDDFGRTSSTSYMKVISILKMDDFNKIASYRLGIFNSATKAAQAKSNPGSVRPLRTFVVEVTGTDYDTYFSKAALTIPNDKNPYSPLYEYLQAELIDNDISDANINWGQWESDEA